MSRSTIRVRALLVAGVLGGSLVLVPGVATAQDTPTCAGYTTQDEAQTAYDDDATGLAALDPNLDGVVCEEFFALDQDGVDGANTDLNAAQVPAGGDDEAAASPADDLLTRIAALQCNSTFNTEFGALNDDIADLPLDSGYGEVFGAFQDRAEALNFCAETTDVVIPTVDDGSIPITSGGQVSVVPEGSAETGAA